MSPGSRVPSGVYPSKGMPPFPILPPTGAEAPFRESTKVLTWVALCVQPGGHRADAAEAARSRPPTCPLQGGSGRSEIQTSHVPTAGQTWPGQQDPGLTCAHCRADAAAVRSRPHTCPLRAEAAGAARSGPHTRPLRAAVTPQGAHCSHSLFTQEPEAQRRSSTARGHTAQRQSRSHRSLHDLQGSLHHRAGRKELVGIGLMGSGQHHCHGLCTLK